MKKSLSFVFALLMLISSLSLAGFSASAQNDIQQIKLNETKGIEYTTPTGDGNVTYEVAVLEFVAPKTRYYEFDFDTMLPNHSCFIEALIRDSEGIIKAFNYFNESSTPYVAAKLEGGKTYRLLMAGDESFITTPYVSNVTVKEHSHSITSYVWPSYTIKDDEFKDEEAFVDGEYGKCCSRCDYTYDTHTIYCAKTATLSANSFTYDGKAKKPTVVVKDRKGNVISSDNYTLKYYENINVGVAWVSVRFKDKIDSRYDGGITAYYKIKPQATTISKLTPNKKRFTVSWKKKTKYVSGYQIQYSTSKDMKNAKTITMPKNSYYAKKITGLKSGKKYYVRVRTYYNFKSDYRVYPSGKWYSSWSAKKTVTTK